VPPLSSFVPLLEYYGLQLQHLSPNSIALVAIFVHLCEMYVGVWPSVRLFRCFFVLKAASPCPLLIGGYYFQCRTQGHAHNIVPISPGRWERWREDWALVQVDAHDRLMLPVTGPTLDCTEWEKDPGLEPVLSREWPNFTDGAARLPVKMPHASPGPVAPPGMDVHQGERHQAAGSWAWV
jgi:hypothetical protein